MLIDIQIHVFRKGVTMKTILVALMIILMSFTIVACTCGTTTVTSSTTPASTTTQSSPAPSTTTAAASTPAATTTQALLPTTSEAAFVIGEVDIVTYRKYFTELGIGLMLNNAKNPPEDLQKNVSIFKSNDLQCLYGNTIIECQPGIKVYSMDTKKIVQDTSLPYAILGGIMNWNSVTFPTGYYLYCVYIGDILVGKYSFQVTE